MKRDRTIPQRIVDELRRHGAIPYHELESFFDSPRPRENDRTRTLRHQAFMKNVARARRLLWDEGKTIATIPLHGEGRKYGLYLIDLPTEACDPQTMAELTLGRAWA